MMGRGTRSARSDGMKTTEEIVDKVEKVAAVLRDKIGTPGSNETQDGMYFVTANTLDMLLGWIKEEDQP